MREGDGEDKKMVVVVSMRLGVQDSYIEIVCLLNIVITDFFD